MATANELVRGRKITVGRNSSAETMWVVRDAADELTAKAALEAAAPTAFDVYGGGLFFLPRQDVSVEEIGGELWSGAVRYAARGGVLSSQLTDADLAVSFRTTGARQLVTQAKKHIADYGRGGLPGQNSKGAINVRDGRPEGVEIVVPAYTWSERWQLTNSQCSAAYRRALRGLTGAMNDYAFRGYEEHEVLFLGADGKRDRPDGDWDIEFQFETSLNRTAFNIPYDAPSGVGAIEGITKDGHDYIWVEYVEDEDAAAFSVKLVANAAHVDRVYDDADFAALGIGT